MGLSNIFKMAALFAASSVVVNAAEVIHGFTPDNSENQYALEAEIDKRINKQNMAEWMEYMTSRPHATGQPFDKEVAEFIAGKFSEWGYDTEIKAYDVLMPTPKVRVVELVEPTKWTAKLKEDSVIEDPTSGQEDRLPIYHSFSPDGDVTAEVVFVNQGLREDYEDLERRGIDVKGKIIIAKYGGSWRGIKPKMAEEKGAIGALIYSDPADDGYSQGEVYPKGAWKHPSGAQRGSIMDLPTRPGDPLTPYIAATKDAKRLELDEVEIFVGIPTLPISYEDAQPILDALEGPVAPRRWWGGLPITYHMGPGPAKLHLKLEFNWDVVPTYNVIAKMEGSDFPDQWVIRGNHHDAWVHGAADPVSGLVVEMEEARILSEIAKETGWKPKRTIVFAAWGAEEQGLMGSVEWVEDHAKELNDKVVAYINTDGNGATILVFEGVPNYPDASRFWQVCDKHKVNIFYTAPTAIRALMGAGDEFVRDTDRSSLRILGSVGEPINPEAWEWYYNVVGEEKCPIVDTWWQTETGGIMITPLPGATALKPGSATRPFFGIKPELVDGDGNILEGKAEGNLCIADSWPGQMRTVYGDHERFIQTYFSTYEGKYFTGDGCRRDGDGYYWITGRVDDVINVSGHRMGTAEVESALVAHDDVAEAAVVGFPHDIKGQGIYAYVTLMSGHDPSEELKKTLVQWVRKEIGPIATPDHIQFAPGLPKTRSGKIMRRILRKITEDDYSNLGDTSTLADPSVVHDLIANRMK
ncbi:AMP-binding protein [Emcibacteraceae bacterium]|nr:AMP-binding protein [Emcibacteraceae bacterium]